MVCSQSFWCRVLSGVLVVGSLSATGCKSGPSFSMPTMPSMAWWQKDKGDLASRAVEQPQPPSSAFSPATSPSSSVASQGNPYGGEANGYQSGYGERTASASGYPSGNTMNAGYDAGGYDTAGYDTAGYGTGGYGAQGSAALPRQPYGSDNTTAMYGGAVPANTPSNYGAPAGYGSGTMPASTTQPNSVNWPASSGATTPNMGPGTTVPNPYATQNPYATPAAAGMPTGTTGYGGTPSTGSGQSGATLTYPNTGMPAISPTTAPSAGRSLPASLSQSQGSYTPGSTGGMGTAPSNDSRTADLPMNSSPYTPTATTPSYPSPTSAGSGGAFQVPGGGAFPGSQPNSGLYR
jgi:hypothetical protein